MRRQDLNLKSILDVPQFEALQDAIAKAVGVAIVTVDYKGTPLTKHSSCTEFCCEIRGNPISRKRCNRCDALAGLEAVRLNRPFIYLCHCGIVDVAVPITVGDKYLGAVMFGQVRIPNDDTEQKVNRLVSEISSFQSASEENRKELLEKFEKIPEMDYGRIQELAEMINAIIQYIVNRAIDKENQSMTYEWMLKNLSSDTSAGQSGYLNVGIQELREPPSLLSSVEETVDLPVSKSSPIYPAVAYVENHKNEMVKMRDMADLCHLSASYFSKIFPMEIGENFTDYVNRRKIEWAKRMLREGNESINRIAMELGYGDSSYFIKVFKKFEGITPHVYRQYKYK